MVLSARIIIALISTLLSLPSGASNKTNEVNINLNTENISYPIVKSELSGKVKEAGLSSLPPELRRQLKNKKTMPIAYWEDVAQCETQASTRGWTNGGMFSGGLGIYRGTWNNFGGRDFALTPQTATKEEQIIIANRIAVFGYQTKNEFRSTEDKIHNKPLFRRRVGYFGWGCIKNNQYLHLETWKYNNKKTAKSVKKSLVSKSSVNPSSRVERSSEERKRIEQAMKRVPKDSTKRCPQWEPLIKKYELPVELYSYIMWRESRCTTKAIGWNYKRGAGHWNCKLAPAGIYKKCKAVKSYDSGLLQINSSWVTLTSQVCNTVRGDMDALLFPECNVRISAILYDEARGLANWGFGVK